MLITQKKNNFRPIIDVETMVGKRRALEAHFNQHVGKHYHKGGCDREMVG
jgi:hypothetical protein